MKIEKQVYIYAVTLKGKEIASKLFSMGLQCKGFIDKRAPEIHNVEVDGKVLPCYTMHDIENPKECIVIVTNKYAFESADALRWCGFQKIISIEDLCNPDNFYIPIRRQNGDFRHAHPFNHYESPYAELDEIRENCDKIYCSNKSIMGINTYEDEQINLLKNMYLIGKPLWENKGNYRYNEYDNGWFGKGSAWSLYYIMNYFKPRKIIEIGSGFSTAAMLDINENCLNDSVDIQCIEPRPQRLLKNVKKTDKIDIMECDLQDVNLDIFNELDENDILFIDSSHIGKTYSDVLIEIFDILPRLKPGVIIHFHDCFWPFEYPVEWLEEGYAYNELFILRAFLMYNNQYKILLFGDQLMETAIDKIPTSMRECGCHSLWIKKDK